MATITRRRAKTYYTPWRGGGGGGHPRLLRCNCWYHCRHYAAGLWAKPLAIAQGNRLAPGNGVCRLRRNEKRKQQSSPSFPR
ncbi:hypothetical protein ZHAS_00007577 [Anopheles sinensis]|uniref:Uncharacterized protein n=1 Tax=Anopheles sinensis TaxID=74873 RepID=A0A084VQF9_ANOSI|nr:hypothetical protein ZHAS_00007577 [Anopheles sinensis]